MDSTKAFVEFASPARRNQHHSKSNYGGRFLDLRTLSFALTNEKLTLESACKEFQTERMKIATAEHGEINAEYIHYNINDTLITHLLYLKMAERYNSFHLNLPLEKAYSPASIGKQYLRQMSIKPFLEKNPDFPSDTLGYVMTTYYGGRSEVRIRKRLVKVRYMDFTSMYPDIFSLMALWPYLTAERTESVDATRRIRRLVENADLETLRNPDIWKDMIAIALIQPEDDVLPVRSRYRDKQAYNIGIEQLTSQRPLWYTLPDVIASKLLTGKSPKILKAIKFIPKGKQARLSSVKIVGNYTVSPDEDLFLRLIQLRKEVQKERDEAPKDSARHQTLYTFQNELKTIASSASYGIYIEVNTEDVESEVDVYGLEHYTVKAYKKEKFGHFFHPIISTMLTSGARLLLAMAERWLTQHDGYYAFCDTDSMAVSPFHWKKLQQFFEPLNPFGTGEFLKLEEENFDDHGQLRELWFYGISAKRYVLYCLDDKEEPVPIKWSSHGLGHLLHENEEEWEKKLWTNILRYALGKISKEELLVLYANEYAVARLGLTKPHLLLRVKAINKGKSTANRIKPYNFVLVGSPARVNQRGIPIIPLTNFTRSYDLAPHQEFVDAKSGKHYMEYSESYWKKLDKTIEEYIEHPESKFENGHRCGTMRRRHITVDSIVYIGKEANELEEREILGLDNETYVEYQTLAAGD